MKEILCFVIVYWYTFCGTGGDPFGGGTHAFPWFAGDDADAGARCLTLSKSNLRSLDSPSSTTTPSNRPVGSTCAAIRSASLGLHTGLFRRNLSQSRRRVGIVGHHHPRRIGPMGSTRSLANSCSDRAVVGLRARRAGAVSPLVRRQCWSHIAHCCLVHGHLGLCLQTPTTPSIVVAACTIEGVVGV